MRNASLAQLIAFSEESQGFWISQDTRAQGTSWTDDDNLLKAAFGRMLEWVHGGNVLFQCQPCAGNSNQTSHNNDTFTRWLIRYQLDELSLGNLHMFMWQITQESGWGEKKWTWYISKFWCRLQLIWEWAHAAGGDDCSRSPDGTTWWAPDVTGL